MSKILPYIFLILFVLIVNVFEHFPTYQKLIIGLIILGIITYVFYIISEANNGIQDLIIELLENGRTEEEILNEMISDHPELDKDLKKDIKKRISKAKKKLEKKHRTRGCNGCFRLAITEVTDVVSQESKTYYRVTNNCLISYLRI